MKKNVLKSLLFVCLGLITANVFTSARVPIYCPSAPGAPIVIDVHKDRCTIKYTAPKNNGGAPLGGYYIEMKDGKSFWWMRINSKEMTPGLEYTVKDLVEGDRVQFRVIAVNIAGESPASEASDVVTIRDL